MLHYLKRVLELTRPYRFRFGLGLACGFLSGALAFTLPVSLKLAVDAVFPPPEAAVVKAASATLPSAASPTPAASPTKASGQNDQSMKQALLSRLPAPLKNTLDNLQRWIRPAGRPSRGRLL